VFQASLTATGRVVKRTRKTGLVECDVTDDEGRLVARAKSTCLVLEGEDAKGR
jgi:acyl-coenzyme A thioesterase PaaI-like protein